MIALVLIRISSSTGVSRFKLTITYAVQVPSCRFPLRVAVAPVRDLLEGPFDVGVNDRVVLDIKLESGVASEANTVERP